MPPYNSDADSWSVDVTTDSYGVVETVNLADEAREQLIEHIRDSIEITADAVDFSPSFSLINGTDEHGDFQRDTMPEIDEPSIGVWYFEQLREHFEDAGVGNIYAGQTRIGPDANGRTAMREMLLREIAREVRDAINDQPASEREERAFNEVTERWPIKARAYLADYYVDEYDADGRFAGELEDFARSEGVLNREIMQTTLDCYYDGNPFNDDSLTRQEATTVMWLREMDDWGDEPRNMAEVLAEIENHENFREWLEREEDIGAALRGHIYDADFPSELASEMAPPEEWPDDMDPADMDRGTCVRCGSNYQEVFHHDDGRAWMRNGSVQTDAIRINDASCPLEVHDGDLHTSDDRLLCSACTDDWESHSDAVTVYHNEMVCRLTGSRSVILDHGNIEDSGYDDRTMLPGAVRQDALDLLSGGADGSYITMAPADGPGRSGRKHELMNRLATGVSTSIPDETIFVVRRNPDFGDINYRVHVKRDNWDAAREAKEMLEAVGTDDEPVQDYETLGADTPTINV